MAHRHFFFVHDLKCLNMNEQKLEFIIQTMMKLTMKSHDDLNELSTRTYVNTNLSLEANVSQLMAEKSSSIDQ